MFLLVSMTTQAFIKYYGTPQHAFMTDLLGYTSARFVIQYFEFMGIREGVERGRNVKPKGEPGPVGTHDRHGLFQTPDFI